MAQREGGLRIIPYQVITGNYNSSATSDKGAPIIPYQVITGNYNINRLALLKSIYYTIPSDNRELQHIFESAHLCYNYTIPSDNRELQPLPLLVYVCFYYTIPSDNRELQQTRLTRY